MSKAMEYLDEKSLLGLAKRFIKTESLSGKEDKLVKLLAVEMSKARFQTVKYDKETNDIVGVLPGLGRGKTLALVGHIDTVPAGTMENPFNPKELEGSKLGSKGKVLWGRGSSDKAGLAAMIAAGAALKRARSRLKGDFVIVGLARTKIGKSSTLKEVFKRNEINPDFVVSCSPTNMKINTAHPGQLTFEALTKGEMTNIGNPNKEENAIHKMNAVLEHLEKKAPLPEDKKFGKAKMIVSSIASKPNGDYYSVPYLCQSLLVRQCFKGEVPEKVQQELVSVLKKNGFKETEVKINLKKGFPPYEVPPSEEIIAVLEEAAEFVLGKKAEHGFWSSGINIAETFNIKLPVVGFGPGNEKFSHTPREHVLIDQLYKAARTYTVLAEKICVAMKVKT